MNVKTSEGRGENQDFGASIPDTNICNIVLIRAKGEISVYTVQK